MNNKHFGTVPLMLVGSLAAVVVGLLVAANAFGVPAVRLDQPLTGVLTGALGNFHPTPVRLVIQNATDYANFFGGTPPSTPMIDFTKQDVIAVSMGNEPTGGYSLDITRSQVLTSGPIAGTRYVYVAEHHPVLGDVVNLNPTQPFAVVAVSKGPYQTFFVDLPIAQSFSQIMIETQTTTPGQMSTFTLHANGSVQLQTGTGPVTKRQAIWAEVDAVDAANIAAQVQTLPEVIPNSCTPPGSAAIELYTEIKGKEYYSTATPGCLGSYGPRLQPVLDAIQATDNRMNGPMLPLPFSQFSVQTGAGIDPSIETAAIDQWGNVTYTRAQCDVPCGLGAGTTFTGHLTPEQVQILGDAQTALLPPVNPPPFVPAIPPAGPFVLADPYDYTPPLFRTPQRFSLTPAPGGAPGSNYTFGVGNAGGFGVYGFTMLPLYLPGLEASDQVAEDTTPTVVTGPLTYTPSTNTSPDFIMVGAIKVGNTDPFFKLLLTTQLLVTNSFGPPTVSIQVSGEAVVGLLGKTDSSTLLLPFPTITPAAGMKYPQLAAGTLLWIKAVKRIDFATDTLLHLAPGNDQYFYAVDVPSEGQSGFVKTGDAPVGNTAIASAVYVNFSPQVVIFPDTPNGLPGPTWPLTLFNLGKAPAALTLSPNPFSGPNGTEFMLESNGCPPILDPGTGCRLGLRFNPSGTGPRFGTFTVPPSSIVGPNTVTLEGQGEAGKPNLIVSAEDLVFTSQEVSTTSAPESLTLSNVGGTAPVTVFLEYRGDGDFSPTTTCVKTIAAGDTCTIDFTFTPNKSGPRMAVLHITDVDGGLLKTVTLSGTGMPSLAIVPNVIGMPVLDAEADVRYAGLLPTTTITVPSNAPYNTVVRLSTVTGDEVDAGEVLAVDTKLTLYVSGGPAQATVPNVVGKTGPVAIMLLTNAGLSFNPSSAYSNTVPPGSVISQDHPAGSNVPGGTVVGFVVSLGKAPTQVTVPPVVGLTQTAATAALTGTGLTVGTVTSVANAAPAGIVLSQSPAAGSTATQGSTVNLTVSSGPAQVTVPSVVGLTQAAATAALTGTGLTVGTVTRVANAAPVGTVLIQSPMAGSTAQQGSAVTLAVSSGPAQVTVPSVVGLTQAAATTALTGAGLTVGTVTSVTNAAASGTVLSETPAAGSTAPQGSAVNLTVSSGPASTVPGPPTGVTATAGVGSATIFWTAPLSNGGSPITSYAITPRIGATSLPAAIVTGAPPVTTTTVSGLTRGAVYTFTVSASNAVGTGPVSLLSNPVIP
jgi:beta-lactam-binding protein with PASTA domain